MTAMSINDMILDIEEHFGKNRNQLYIWHRPTGSSFYFYFDWIFDGVVVYRREWDSDAKDFRFDSETYEIDRFYHAWQIGQIEEYDA